MVNEETKIGWKAFSYANGMSLGEEMNLHRVTQRITFVHVAHYRSIRFWVTYVKVGDNLESRVYEVYPALGFSCWSLI